MNTYSGGITIPKVNPINFNKVFSNFAELLRGNPTVFATLFSILFVYILLAIWVRRKDKKDVEKVHNSKPFVTTYYRLQIIGEHVGDIDVDIKWESLLWWHMYTQHLVDMN